MTAVGETTSLGRNRPDDHESDSPGALELPSSELPSEIGQRLNADPEFRKEVRGWSATLVFYVGDTGHTLVLHEGVVTSFGPTVHKLRPCTAEFRGTRADWAALLSFVPPPFYQDFMGAIFNHGFVLAGDMEEVFSRYAGVRRMLEVMRIACNEGPDREGPR